MSIPDVRRSFLHVPLLLLLGFTLCPSLHACSTEYLTGKRGSFTSPLFPSNYRNRMNCAWEITAEANHVIQLKFNTFILEGPSYCPYDWVKIYDGDTLSGNRHCGLSIPEPFTSSGNKVRVEFHSDRSVTYQGFSASYIAYDPNSAWTLVGPHIKTLDGGTYTFNGFGEYILISLVSSNLTFMLQGRTGLAETEDGKTTNATVFKAFGAKEDGTDVFIGLDPETEDTLIIYSKNTDRTKLFADAGMGESFVESEVSMMKRSSDSIVLLVVTFASDIQLTISVSFKALDISITIPVEYRGMTRGLLGNFDGNNDNDFILPNGSVLSSNLTDRQIFQDFGPEWAVTSNNSVFQYPANEGPADYSHPDFTPLFLDEAQEFQRKAAEDQCGATSIACIYDYIATGSATIADAKKSI